MRDLSALLLLAVAGLVAVAVVKIRHHDYATGTQLIAWAFVPLALLLVFVWPTLCKVKTSRGKACLNDAYGFMFGCNRFGHRFKKLSARLRLPDDAPIGGQRRQQTGNQASMLQAAPGQQHMKVTIEDTKRAVCGFWIGLAASVVTIIEFVHTFASH